MRWARKENMAGTKDDEEDAVGAAFCLLQLFHDYLGSLHRFDFPTNLYITLILAG